MAKKTDYVWMEITKDAYELPIIVCDTVQELSKKSGASVNNIYSIVSKYEAGVIQKPRFIRVCMDDALFDTDPSTLAMAR